MSVNNAYVLSTMSVQPKYEDLVAQLNKKNKQSALQMLLYFDCDDAVVAPL